MTRKTNKQIRQEVTATIIDALHKGTSPWQKPWTPEGGSGWPHNCITGHEYRGANFPFLMAVQAMGDYPTAQWLTFRQARNAGGTVRKGEKACHVVFAKPLMVKDEDDPTGRKKKKIFFLRQTPVFNIAQCDNVKLPKKEQPVEVEPREDEEVAKAAQKFMRDRGCKFAHNGGRAYYNPSKDHVRMPYPHTFKNGEGYAATAYHETVHWTGHESRCKRDMKGTFGTESYAFEELVAELGAAMVCQAQGVSSEMEQHASYIQSWIKKLESDESYIFKAAKLSEAAVNYLLPETARKGQEAA